MWPSLMDAEHAGMDDIDADALVAAARKAAEAQSTACIVVFTTLGGTARPAAPSSCIRSRSARARACSASSSAEAVPPRRMATSIDTANSHWCRSPKPRRAWNGNPIPHRRSAATSAAGIGIVRVMPSGIAMS